MTNVMGAAKMKMRNGPILFWATCLALGGARPAAADQAGSGTVHSVVELTFTGPTMGPADRPVVDVDFWVRFRHESGSPEYKVHGFWDGNGSGGTTGNIFRVRFCPTKTGRWDLVEVFSNRVELHGKKQGDHVAATSSSHPGFWIPDGRWFKRSDGSYPYLVGNTHYDFLSRPNGNEAAASSIRSDVSANAAYFKKLRFCLMSPRPENASTTLRPFFDGSGNQTHTETDRPNPKYFRERVDVAVLEGYAKDLVCDLILGGTAGDQVADSQAYMKYVAARYGAYPNVWICLANEWNEQASAAHEKNNGAYLRTVLAYPVPMSTHGTGGWNSSLNGAWLTHTIRQLKTGDLQTAAAGILADFSSGGGKPAVNDENGYDPDEASTADVVEGITGSFAGGGYGTTGHKTGSKLGGYFWGHAARGKSITEHPSTSHLKFLREKIDEHVTFWRMTPKGPSESIFSGAAAGFRVLEWANNEYVLLSDAADGSVTANLPSGTWKVIRLDAWAKSETTLASSASGPYAFSTPNSRAVLTVFKKSGVSGPTAPAAPTGLQATAASSSRIDLSWTDNSSNEDGFRVERSTNNATFSTVATVGANVKTYADTGLSAGTTYYYRVVASNSAGDSPASNVAGATTGPATAVAITDPPAGTFFAPGEQVTMTGMGSGLSWSIDRLNDAQGAIATGTGSSVTFTVPLDSTNAHRIRVDLTGTGGSDTRTYDIVDSAPTVTTVSADLSPATVGAAYSDDIEATGGDAPLSWSASGLPPGLSLSASGGTLSGAPTMAGTFTFTVTVVDHDGDAHSKSLTMTVQAAGAGGITGTSPSAYLWDVLDVGKLQYVDRTFTFSGVPGAYVGLQYLKTRNDDKAAAVAVSFTVDRAVAVYVAHDDRITPRPSWLGGWTDTGHDLVSGGGTFSLFAKDFAAGTVSLGANGGSSSSSMYTVVVREAAGGGGGTFTVRIDSVSTGKPYSLSTAQAGALYYIDRSYTIGSLSSALAGGRLIRTANDDKAVKATAHLKFTVNGAATVHVGYDKRATQAPSWLTDGTWTVTTETLGVSDGSASPMRVYRKNVPAGQVTLGGNLAGPAIGARSNYVVVVKPQ